MGISTKTNATKCEFSHSKEFNPDKYNLAIIHIDENSLNPEICNKYVNRVPQTWGEPSKFLQKSSIKNKVFLMHGHPILSTI